MPGISVSRIPIPFNKGGFSYSSYWTALKAAMTNQPSMAYSIAANSFITSLVEGGVWAKLDRLFVFAAETNDGGEALLDWVHPTGTPAVLAFGAGGSVPTFTANEGFKGNPANKAYINTQYNPTSHGVNYTLNSASMGLYINQINTTGVGAQQSGVDLTTYLSPGYSASSWRGSLNLMNFTSKAKSTTPDLSSVMRDGNTIKRYKNKTSLGDETAAPSGIPNGNVTLLGFAASAYDNSEISMWYAGGLLSETELGVLVDGWNTFFYSISEYEPSYTILSETDDLYAHESQILIKQISGVDYLFMIYMSNKINNKEWQDNARARLRIFNLGTMALVREEDLFYPNLTAGITMTANSEINAPRMYFIGNTIKCYVANEHTLYTRNIDISDSNSANWVVGDISIVQMTMKDAIGGDVTVDVTSSNVQIHLEYTLGEGNALYNGLMPMFRNMDIAKDGDNWYATLELSGERVAVASNICVFLLSTNAGVTWTFGSLVLYTTGSRNRLIEPSVFFVGTDLHIIARSISAIIWHIKSEDSGVTWVQQDDIILDGISQSKPCAINYNDGSEKNILAITEVSKLIGYSGRTTLWFGSLTDTATPNNGTEIMTPTFAHYPSLCYYGAKMYISYTKALKGTSELGNRDSIVFAELV